MAAQQMHLLKWLPKTNVKSPQKKWLLVRCYGPERLDAIKSLSA